MSAAPTPEPTFCTRCDGYGVVLPVGTRVAAVCPECHGATSDRPERGPHGSAAPTPEQMGERLREHAHWQWLVGNDVTAKVLEATADEIDRLRRLLALAAEHVPDDCDHHDEIREALR